MMKVAFDMNGTLTKPEVRWLFQCLARDKCEVIVWSTLGREYCRRFCEVYGLKPDRVIDKQAERVDLAFDDRPETIEVAKEVIEV